MMAEMLVVRGETMKELMRWGEELRLLLLLAVAAFRRAGKDDDGFSGDSGCGMVVVRAHGGSKREKKERGCVFLLLVHWVCSGCSGEATTNSGWWRRGGGRRLKLADVGGR
ncbi:hypothetical protein Droror1_Dr00016121 [Drosera rotundifolia]